MLIRALVSTMVTNSVVPSRGNGGDYNNNKDGSQGDGGL